MGEGQEDSVHSLEEALTDITPGADYEIIHQADY